MSSIAHIILEREDTEQNERNYKMDISNYEALDSDLIFSFFYVI